MLRLRRRRGPALVALLGIAAGACALAATVGGSTVVQERTLARAAALLPAAERVVRVTWAGVPPLGARDGGLTASDAAARAALAGLGEATPRAPTLGAPTPGAPRPGSPTPEAPTPGAPRLRRALILRETRIGGALVDLAATDRLGEVVRLVSGKLPAGCRAERCEVVELGGHGALPAPVAGIRLVVVGRGRLTSDVPFGAGIDRAALSAELQVATGYHQPPQPPLLVAGDLTGLAAVAELGPVYRSVAWIAPLPAAAARPWSVDGFVRAVARARGGLEARSALFGLEAPVEALAAAYATSRAAGRRLLLMGGQAAALLLAFALLAAAGLRREAEATRQRLLWSGVRPWQGLLLAASEAAGIAVAGAAAGWGVGIGAVALVARAAGSPAGAVVAHGVVSAGGLVVVGSGAAVAALLLLVTLRTPEARIGSFAVTPLDVAAIGAVAAVAFGLARGGTGAVELAGGTGRGAGGMVALLPGLAAFAGAVLCGRLLAPGLRLLERRARAAGPALRLAALSLARAPGRSAVTVGVLVAGVGFGLFALAYRSTLDRHLTAEARQQVPADYVLTEDLGRLVSPQAVVSPAQLQRLAPGVSAEPVLRLYGDVNGVGPTAQATVLGLSPSGFGRLAPLLRTGPAPSLRGIDLPAVGAVLTVPVALSGDPVRIDATVLTRAGLFVRLPLGLAGPGAVLRSRLPAEARAGRIVALGLELPTVGTRRGSPGAAAPVEQARGTLRLGLPTVDGRPLAGRFAGWIAGGDAIARGGGVRYAVGNELATFLRPPQATDGKPVPLLVTPRLARLAAGDGTLVVRLGDQQLTGRVVGTMSRFRGVDGDAAVADEATLATALNAAAPGTGVPGEIWMTGPAGLEQALRTAPLDLLSLVSRRAVEHDLRAEPAARGTLVALSSAGLAALVLALLALGSALVADLRDERGELFDLEAQGLGPRRLRAHLGLRALLVAGVGLAGGCALAAVLGALVVRTVAATAGARAPQPPLVLSLAWPELVGAVAGFAALAVALVWLVLMGTFRGPAPGRVVEEGA